MREPLAVMMSFTRPTETSSPYVQLLIAALEKQGVVVEYLSWGKLLCGRKNVLHVHWPETMLQRRTVLGRLANQVFMTILLLRARLGLTRIVRTVHNSAPHERPSGVDRRLLNGVDASSAARIYLSSPEGGIRGELSIVLPHAELGSWYARTQPATDRSDATSPDLLFFGLIRPYKGIEQLLRLAAEAPDVQVRVIGAPADAELASRIAAIGSSLPNVTTDLRHVPDAVLPDEIRSARLVVLPYERFENSGAAALAIDLGVPVLVPSCKPTTELREVFGAEWVHLYGPELTPAEVALALQRVADRRSTGRPIIAEREWGYQAARHASLYRAVRDRSLRNRRGGSR